MNIKFRSLVLSMFCICTLTANDDILISAEDAVKLLDDPNVVFVSGDNDTTYKLGHIRGSVEMYAHHLHHSDKMGEMHCQPLFMCPKEAEEFIGKHGIENDDMIIAYDNFRGPNATGVYAFFKSWGHKNIKILDGGRDKIMQIDPQQKVYDAIKDEYTSKMRATEDNEEKKAIKEKYSILLKEAEKGLMVVKGKLGEIEPKEYHIDTAEIDYDYIAGSEELKKAMEDILQNGKDSQYVIIDTRSFIEIMGERKMDNVARGGHIPGSKFIEWKNFTDFDNTLSFKDKQKMQEVFDKHGITKDKKIYAYCHVGAGRSTHIITALELLGYENAKVYTGSWDSWGNDMNLPIRR